LTEKETHENDVENSLWNFIMKIWSYKGAD